ncbi:clotting factor C-like [Schistocerca serialis cubense]|uniref:clotting factor C-like n=1 Tax=Schistocerca serialis cubense TaxID=2023355 RepID=UPI00214EF8CE|nr:clotting factor C-like [Schistocerca serialis cubense]
MLRYFPVSPATNRGQRPRLYVHSAGEAPQCAMDLRRGQLWPLLLLLTAECVKPIPTDESYLLDGKPSLAAEFPWHVGIYLHENDGYLQLCSGTLIKRKLVLTAAHCLGKSNNPKDYMIVAGKHHRGWDIKDPKEQQLEVDSIVIHDMYRGPSRNYADDIAIIVLKNEIRISDFVRPASLDLESKYEREQLSSGSFGSIAHWDYNESPEPSDVLLMTKLPFIEFSQCYELLPQSVRPLFASDKFCAGFRNGTALCAGDGGGGLLFEQKVTATTKQWFIQGIVSLGSPRGRKPCSGYPVLFTRVNSHLNWLKTYYDKY